MWVRTHYGPEETEDIIKQRFEDERKKKEYLKHQLDKQIEVFLLKL